MCWPWSPCCPACYAGHTGTGEQRPGPPSATGEPPVLPLCWKLLCPLGLQLPCPVFPLSLLAPSAPACAAPAHAHRLVCPAHHLILSFLMGAEALTFPSSWQQSGQGGCVPRAAALLPQHRSRVPSVCPCTAQPRGSSSKCHITSSGCSCCPTDP